MDQKFQASIHEAGHNLVSELLGHASVSSIEYSEKDGLWVGSTIPVRSIIETINEKLDAGEGLDGQDIVKVGEIQRILLAGKIAESIYLSLGNSFGSGYQVFSDSIDNQNFITNCIYVLKEPNPEPRRELYSSEVEAMLRTSYEQLLERANRIYNCHEYR